MKFRAFKLMPVAPGGNRRDFKVGSHIHTESMNQEEEKANALSFYCPQREKSLTRCRF